MTKKIPKNKHSPLRQNTNMKFQNTTHKQNHQKSDSRKITPTLSAAQNSNVLMFILCKQRTI